jgi:hypothetical protein
MKKKGWDGNNKIRLKRSSIKCRQLINNEESSWENQFELIGTIEVEVF